MPCRPESHKCTEGTRVVRVFFVGSGNVSHAETVAMIRSGARRVLLSNGYQKQAKKRLVTWLGTNK